MLDFVDTPRRSAVLTETGRRFVAADPADRQALWRERLFDLRVFRELRSVLERSEGRALDALALQEAMVFWLPQEDYERLFERVLQWGRYGEVLDYDEEAARVSLR
jgi:NitT/TauT family transport system ATP-binding protein